MAAALFAVLGVAQSAHASARLYIPPPGATICQGRDYLLDVRLDANEPVNAGDVNLIYNPSALVMVDMLTSGSIFRFWAEGPEYNNATGYAHMIGGLPTPGFTGTGALVARLQVRSLATGPINLHFDDANTRILRDDGYGTEVSPLTLDAASITVLPSTDPACMAPVTTPGPGGPTPTPLVCPEPPTCILPETASPSGEFVPCDIVQSCPGELDRIYQAFVVPGTPGLDCPVRSVCHAPLPPVAGTTQEEARELLENVLSPGASNWLVHFIYGNWWLLALIAALCALGMLLAVSAAMKQLAGIFGGLGAAVRMLFRTLFVPLAPDRKKTRILGTVYDAVTKHPLAGAKVELLSPEKEVLETRFTDTEGNYGFVVLSRASETHERTLEIRAGRKGYSFPASTPDDIETQQLYHNVYHGGPVVIHSDRLASYDIPLQPEREPSWEPRKTVFSSRSSAWFAAFAETSYRVGIVAAPLNFIVAPSLTSGIIAGVYLLMAAMRSLGAKFRPYGLIAGADSGRSVPYSYVTLTDAAGKRAGQAVSDDHGRFFLRSQRGIYELTTQTPVAIKPVRTQQEVVQINRGWLSKSIRL